MRCGGWETMSSRRADETNIWYQLLRARHLGMFIARIEEDDELLRQIGTQFGSAGARLQPKSLSDLVPLTDREYKTVQGAIARQVEPLREAYLRGMAIAQNDEQRAVLNELNRLVGPPRAA